MQDELISLYHKALNGVINDPRIKGDIERARSLDPCDVTKHSFFSAYAWTVFVSGFRMSVVQKWWPTLTRIFKDWNVERIIDRADIRTRALKILNYERKIDAILTVSNMINNADEWGKLKDSILDGLKRDAYGNILPYQQALACMDALPMIGPTNARYILKNIGYDLAKDDRHLRRLAKKYGYTPDGDGVQLFVETISHLVGERISVVETVLFNACEAGII